MPELGVTSEVTFSEVRILSGLVSSLLSYLDRATARAHQAVVATQACEDAMARECALAREHEISNIAFVSRGLARKALALSQLESLEGLSMVLELKLARVPARFPDLAPVPVPEYKTQGAAGMDLYADLPPNGVWLHPHRLESIPTGFMLQIPEGYEGQVRPRSGLAFKSQVTVINSPGTIDSDFRGEVQVGLINHGQEAVHLQRGDRIAQLVITPVLRPQISLVEREALTDTHRGAGGFGSTGMR